MGERLQEKYQSAQQLGEEVKALKTELDTKQGNISPDTLLALLQASNQQVEEESEIMMDEFLSQGGSVEDFLEQYHDKRKLAHMRRVKVDKLKELTTKKQGPARSAPLPPTGQGRSPGGVPNYNWSGGPGYDALPYPSQPVYNMPMPSYR